MDANAPLTALPAVAVIEQFRRGELSPVTLVNASIERIERLNVKINAITATCFDRAREEARASEARYQAGQPKGPLDGLTLGVKDLQPTAQLLTTWGSPKWRNHVPQEDLPMVAALRRAGAIVVGKTNVPEHGAGGNSRNPVWGATGNPFNANLVAGGSSGGSAAALAADLVTLCTGSDTGGSLRLPAGLCGIVGFRPSPGLVPHPTRPLGWSSISVLGPMARNMGDLLLMLRSCMGTDARDPLNRGVSPESFNTTGVLPRLETLRIGYSEDFGGCSVEPDIRAAFRDRIERIAPQVAKCVPVDIPHGDWDRCFDVMRAESFMAGFQDVFDHDPVRLSEDIQANVALGKGFTLGDRAWAHLEQTRIMRAYQAQAAHLDLILSPVAPVTPFVWTQGFPAHIDGVAMDIYYRWLALTYRPSLVGCPALTLPCGLDSQRMPFSLQLLGSLNGDAALLQAAQTLEAFFESHEATRRPRPDLEALKPSTTPLNAMVTHPPESGAVPPSGSVATVV
ncbi:amidase [Hydrogenophaga crassostreae]|uniref:Amidase n=1 Tax=Hydrogenophaga crassostreae TaxID=1763535 RepID=A0A163CA20_9BURK|nr:amidase [Hydrogenophaga crassostreae]AOW12575.1 amidase [Hydrogenophaga crassostreae]OAD40444.1 amidase [Hydrogenophaga crassostreae]